MLKKIFHYLRTHCDDNEFSWPMYWGQCILFSDCRNAVINSIILIYTNLTKTYDFFLSCLTLVPEPSIGVTLFQTPKEYIDLSRCDKCLDVWQLSIHVQMCLAYPELLTNQKKDISTLCTTLCATLSYVCHVHDFGAQSFLEKLKLESICKIMGIKCIIDFGKFNKNIHKSGFFIDNNKLLDYISKLHLNKYKHKNIEDKVLFF